MKKRTLYAVAAIAAAAAATLAWHDAPAGAKAAPQPTPAPAAALKRPLLLSGMVDAMDSQPIIVPPSNSSPVVLRNFIDEGAVVKVGDVLLQTETSESGSVRQLKMDAELARSRAEKETADLDVKAVEAELELAKAAAALAKAKVDAALPKAQISALDFDRYQGERERAARDFEVKQKTSAGAAEAVARRRTDAELEMKKLQVNIAFSEAQQELVIVRAKRAGVVVHGYSEWRGERFDEGSSAFPGNTVGQVMGTDQMRVRGWALEADRPFIAEGQTVRLGFDALPRAAVTAKIKTIASAPEARGSWGNGRYFRFDIELPANHALPLVAGMSVLVEPVGAPSAGAAAPAPAELAIEGEIASRVASPISPPAIPDVYQFTLSRLAPEGSPVRAGQPIATFDANQIASQLATAVSALKEKQSALAKTRLENAERERSAALAIAEAQSNYERAQRKATQPKELIRRVDYDKLVIERDLAERLAALALRQGAAQQRARKAEVAGLLGEIGKHEDTIGLLTNGQAALTVKAARDGIVMYRKQFNGEKFVVGSQVWKGLSVATLADPAQLIVRAKVPEVQAAAIQLGQGARVTVPGANTTLAAKVSGLGHTYHGKSQSQPIIVLDIELEFESAPKDLKPGAAVQVSLRPAKGKT
jgi:multidrug efflux pump subunit AcrA (membrane-fusion protein)